MKQGPGPLSEVAYLLYTDAQRPPLYDQVSPTGVDDLDRLFITLRSQAAAQAAQIEVTKECG